MSTESTDNLQESLDQPKADTVSRRTKGGQKIVISAWGKMNEGFVLQVTLPNGKYAYFGVNSISSTMAREQGLNCEEVRYFGNCIDSNINGRAHIGSPIQINEISVADFIEEIATDEECRQFWNGEAMS